ncbi:Leucine-rich repeat receptor-like protein kinase [Quillaja saponaria]|uniref:Leucine-rich repeat receptor-like protein kinase n=1 Tax=Quillaja saponaria TaxID=32244 RepID=A0AAD7LW08_QUISA|nr:Leucine-rich repeat receptor-like protein kinase [Quillaja saponaria]
MSKNKTLAIFLYPCAFIFSITLILVASASLPPSAIYLLQFHDSLPQNSQHLLQWNHSNSPSSPCHWPGVSCYPNKEFQVKDLNLSGFGLSGVLNSSISYLCLHKHLISLDLSGSNFTGPIPQLLGNCGQLNTILLNDNGFEGSIPPQLFQSKWLSKIDLGYNSLTGSIPPEVSFCINLEYIGLYNNFLVGEVPSEIFSLPKLKYLYLNTNNLTGSLPDFSHSCAISEIWIHENAFSGSLPSTLSNCHNLSMFIASENNFKGVIPPEIFKGLLQLEVLYLDKNHLEGEIADTLWGLEWLQELVLSGNSLNGSINENIAQCHQLTLIALSGNKLNGQIPKSIGSLKHLNTLFLFDNKLDGPLPPELGNCSSLVDLRLQNNFIGGTFPPEICNLENIEVLLLFNNRIEGRIPQQIAQNNLSGEMPAELGKNSPGLVKLDLTSNHLHGPISSSICTGNNLSVLVLGNNRFDGSFPIKIGKCSSLRRVILSNNLLRGSIPANLEQNSGISYLEVRGNLLEGIVPSVFGLWSNLSMLDFSENRLSGYVPQELGNLEKLQILRISSNRLTGSIPSMLGHCTKLIKLDLSYNCFSGNIPPEITSLARLQSLLLQGNKFAGPIPDSFSSTESLLELQLGSNLLEGPIPCSLGSFLGNQELCLLDSQTKYCGEQGKVHARKKVQAAVILGVVISLALICALVYVLVFRCLKQKPTPYRSLDKCQSRTEDLPEDLKFEDIMRATEGWSDKYVIGRGKHGKVYRMESINSRKKWAVKKVDMSETNFNHEMRTLSLVRHRNVVRMAGYCIKDGYGCIVTEYMPGGTLFDVLHRTRSTIIGTLGYIAPENAYSTQLTEKCDVYSYGVILLELLCRKLPVDPCFEEGLDIVSWTKKKLQDSDECLCFLDEEISYWDKEEQQKALRLLDLAVECTQVVADARPSMRDVVAFLIKLNDRHEKSVYVGQTSKS